MGSLIKEGKACALCNSLSVMLGSHVCPFCRVIWNSQCGKELGESDLESSPFCVEGS